MTDVNETLKVSSIVSILNRKFAENYENDQKAEILNEILNEIKLFLMPAQNQEIH